MNVLNDLFSRHLACWQTGWSMGAFGAIAEFHQDDGEISVSEDRHGLARATKRGGLRLDPARVAEIVPVAYETLSPRPHRWNHAVALCLPEAQAKRAGRAVLTELGPDDQSIRDSDRSGILFDMGLSLPQCDFCVRTSDPKLLAVLRGALGQSVLEPDDPVMSAILHAHPHRVALTNIGRLEVYQKIGGPDTGGVSPPGPHTHLLPKLLRSGRTHSANTPIPDGFLPLGSMHPGNPVIDRFGEDRPFEERLHRDFRALLESYGNPHGVALKKQILGALRDGEAPDRFALPDDRFARTLMRLTLRQQARQADFLQDNGAMQQVARWQAVFDKNAEIEGGGADTPA